MKDKTRQLWAKQDIHQGDRWRLFRAVGKAANAENVLYPGCYVDIAPSFVFPAVTYVDVDVRTPGFFGDQEGVLEIVSSHDDAPSEPGIRFIHSDYTHDLDLPDQAFDLLVSLYAGFVSEHCTNHLRIGGTLLVNPSHGDAAMASIDPRYKLTGVVVSSSGNYRVGSANLDTYLVPKKPVDVTAEMLHKLGRGIGYTKSPLAYLYRRVR